MVTEDLVRRAASQAGLDPLAVLLRRLDTEEASLAIAPDAAFYPASMIKTPLAAAALALVEEGSLDLDQPCEVRAPNMTLNDKPSPLVPGYRSHVRELIDLMLTRSDNVATNVLFDLVGRRRATEIAQRRLGLTGTAFHRKLSGSLPLISDPEWDRQHLNTHPPSDAAQLFEAIARSRVPFAWMLRDTLARQEWNDRLSLGLQPGDRFAHKTGDTDEVTHDGGILESSRGALYVIVVYTGMAFSEEVSSRFGRFMATLRPAL